MNWSGNHSIRLSQACVAVFALLLLGLDAACPWLARYYVAQVRGDPLGYAAALMAAVYLGSVLGWVTLYRLWRLLDHLRRGRVFVEENVRDMRTVSWCCAGAAVLSAGTALVYLPWVFGVVAVSAGFMALIVRIVKNVFQQAIAMKSELDLTV